jgi:alkanesulfonate monooxygenase SsuD/methylene tetrahydromethanopterin reductase-like flavin-dependent oxidoreductase (luciferase family)
MPRLLVATSNYSPMKASLLCGAHYEGAEAHLVRPPVPPSMCDPAIAQQTFDHSLSYAALADAHGFDWVSVSEHHSSPLILAPSVAPIAGALTQIVQRANLALLGPLAPLNNPVRVAEEIAMLDQLSHGRVVVLPLRGSPTELNAYGPRELALSQPITQEATRLIRKALSEPEPFAWEGEHFQFQKVAVWPRVLQKPFPPMYFSGNSLNSAMFAARERLGLCISFHRPEVVAQTIKRYCNEAAVEGWQPVSDQIVYRNHIIVADTDERARKLAEVFVPGPSRHLLEGPALSTADAEADASVAERALAEFPRGQMLFWGSPDRVTNRIRIFHELTGVGVLDLIFGSGQIPPDAVRHSIELFGREVLPRIRDMGTC